MMSYDPYEFLKFLMSAEESVRITSALMIETDKEKEDIMHYIELVELADIKKIETVYNILRRILKFQRELKASHETFILIDKWVKDNQSAVKSFEKLLDNLRDIENGQDCVYSPRTKILDGLKTSYTEQF